MNLYIIKGTRWINMSGLPLCGLVEGHAELGVLGIKGDSSKWVGHD